jgi:hypothetical protein
MPAPHRLLDAKRGIVVPGGVISIDPYRGRSSLRYWLKIAATADRALRQMTAEINRSGLDDFLATHDGTVAHAGPTRVDMEEELKVEASYLWGRIKAKIALYRRRPPPT